MKQRKKILSALCLVTAAAMAVSCSRPPVSEMKTDTDKVSLRNISEKRSTEEKKPEVFSVLTVSKDSTEINADGCDAGKSVCGFTLQDDGSVTVNVDGKEVDFEEAAEKTGCTLTENADGSISIQAPFQKSQVVVKAHGEFDTHGAQSVDETVKNHFLLTYASPSEAYSAFKLLSEDENVEYAEANEIFRTTGFEDTKRIDNWGLARTGAVDFCREISEKNGELPEIDVAVIDTGIYYEHEIFEGRILDGGRNFCDGYSSEKMNSAEDDDGHGTHCAGIICSATNDNVKILPVKVVSAGGYGESYGIFCGMMYAIECNADIISMSLGGYGKTHLLAEAVQRAHDEGITVCVAAGNESLGSYDSYSSLCEIDECVVVSSVDENLNFSEFSNYQNIDFAAPGEDILSASLSGPDESEMKSGTSMAAPYAAACFANVLSADSTLSSEEVYDIIKANTVDLFEPGYDEKSGWGLVNLKKFRMTAERVDDPELRPSAEPEVIPPETTGETFESEKIVIQNGVLTYFDTEEVKILNLAELVSKKEIPEFYEFGESVFAGSEIKEITLPDSVKTIPDNAFSACVSLERVVTCAENIGSSAFELCTNLTELCDSNIKSVGSSAFLGCYDLEKADFTGITEIPPYAFSRCEKIKTEFFRFENITSVGDNAFAESGLHGSVNLISADRIGKSAFRNTGIEEAFLSDKITRLPSFLFYGCDRIRKISAPSAVILENFSLALEKQIFSEKTVVETDIDFSKVTEIEEYAFSGFVFSEPVSFDALEAVNLGSFSHAYGESVSFPSAAAAYTTVDSDTVFLGSVYFDSVITMELSNLTFSGVICTGNLVESIDPGDNFTSDQLRMCCTDNDPDVTGVFRENNINFIEPDQLYLTDENADSICIFDNYFLNAVLPGHHLKYSWSLRDRESGEMVLSEENSEFPVSFTALGPGEFTLSIEIKDEEGSTVFFRESDLTAEGTEPYTLTSDTPAVIKSSGTEDGYGSFFTFTPEKDGYYWLDTSGYSVDIISASGKVQSSQDNPAELYLKGGEPCCIIVYTEFWSGSTYISVSSEKNTKTSVSDAVRDGGCVQCYTESDGSHRVVISLEDGTVLNEGEDYTTEILGGYGDEDVTALIYGTGNYYGVYEAVFIFRPLIKTDEPYYAEFGAVDFIPEKSGIYNIIFTPDRDDIENVIECSSNMAGFSFMPRISIPEFADRSVPYDTFYPEGSMKITGQSELSVYIEKGVRYRISNEAELSEILITEKPSVSQCDAQYGFSYELNGEPVTPDIRLYDNGKLLEEGKDYRLTVWNNAEPGIMYAIAEGCGEYSGIRNFAMLIEGGELKAGKQGDLDVIDVRPNWHFEYLGFLPYRITFDRDTFVSVSSTYAEFTGTDNPDTVYSIGEYDTGVFVKKGTYIFRPYDTLAFQDNYYRENFIVNTYNDKRTLDDAEVEVSCDSHGNPVITVMYDGELLEENRDYIAVTGDEDTESFTGTVKISGHGNYTGTAEVQYVRLPVTEGNGVLSDSETNRINPAVPVKYEWIPENEKCIFISSLYTNTKMLITDENNRYIWDGTVNIKKIPSVTVEPGRKYYVYIYGDFTDELELDIRTEGRLSDCEAVYDALIPFDGISDIPEVVFRDGSYVLEEGRDYVLSHDGFVNAAGLREYIYTGCGKYYGDAVVSVVTYMENLPDLRNFVTAVPGKDYYDGYRFYYNLPGSPSVGKPVRLKVSSEEDMLYHIDLAVPYEECRQYLNVFMYDSAGRFMGANDDVKDFRLESGQTVYIMVVPPYFLDETEQEDAYHTVVYLTTEEDEYPENVSDIPGDVNCDGEVNIFDFMRLRKFILGDGKLSKQGMINAVFEENSVREAPDVKDLLILKKIILMGSP